MKIKTQVSLSLGIITLLLILLAVGGYIALGVVKTASAVYPNVLVTGILNNSDQSKALLELQLAVHQKDRQKIEAINAEFRERIISFAGVDPEGPLAAEQMVITGVRETSERYLAVLDAALAEDLSQPVSQRFTTAVNNLSNTQYTPDQVIQYIIDLTSNRIDTAISTITSIFVGAGFFAAIVSILMGALLSRRLKRSLEDLQYSFRRVSTGDLTAQANAKTKDEFGELAGYFNELSGSLKNTIQEMAEMMTDLSDISTRFKESGVSFEQRARSTSDETQMVATAMTEMAATIREVAQNAENTARQAQDANSQADSARILINNSVSRSKQLQTQMGGISDQVLQLKEKTQSISTVIDVIQGIAEQTNLLALNAAIEAARAGEQGRGFAVVADEVRTLATRTASSTQEIVDVIKALQSMAENTSTQIAQGTEDVEKNAKAIAEINEGLTSILTNISSISDMNHQIATNSQEQSHVAEDMNTNIVRISDLAEQNAAQTEQINADITLIDSLTQHVKKLVGKFQY